TGPVGDNILPQLSVTFAGGAGCVASLIQLTVLLPLAGNVKGSISIVTVCDHTWELPSQSVYVQLNTISPSQFGAAAGALATGVIGLPQASVAQGCMISSISSAHAAIDVVLSGKIKSSISTVTVCVHTCECPAQSV